MFKAPSRFKNGVNNLSAENRFANLPVPSEIDLAVTIQDHFLLFNASNWTVGGTGTPARAIYTTDPRGVVGLTTSGASSDSNFIFVPSPAWRTTRVTADTAPATLMFGMRVKATTASTIRVTGGFTTGATNSDIFPTTVNGIIFDKASGGTTLNLVIGNGTTATTTAVLTTFAGSAYYDLGFVVEKGVVTVFVNGVKTNTITGVTTFPSTTANLYAGMGVLTASAAAVTLYVDTFLASGDNV